MGDLVSLLSIYVSMYLSWNCFPKDMRKNEWWQTWDKKTRWEEMRLGKRRRRMKEARGQGRDERRQNETQVEESRIGNVWRGGTMGWDSMTEKEDKKKKTRRGGVQEMKLLLSRYWRFVVVPCVSSRTFTVKQRESKLKPARLHRPLVAGVALKPLLLSYFRPDLGRTIK